MRRYLKQWYFIQSDACISTKSGVALRTSSGRNSTFYALNRSAHEQSVGDAKGRAVHKRLIGIGTADFFQVGMEIALVH
jgi:hypothetical protein